METPLKIVLRDVAPYDDVVEEEVRGLAAKLEKYYHGSWRNSRSSVIRMLKTMTSCRMAL